MFFSRKKKIDEDILKYHFSKDKKLILKEIESTDLGIGWINISNRTWRNSKEFSNSDFKTCINEYFLPLIESQGFIGKDYKFQKEDERNFYVINFFPNRNGGSTQVDLLVKVKGITYPPKHIVFKKSKSTKYCEFSKRLSPINTSVWHWAFKTKSENNRVILEDVFRIFSEKGIPYFKQFEDQDFVISKISIETLKGLKFGTQNPKTGFPSLYRDFYEELLPSVYFIFKYALLNNDLTKAKTVAEFGVSKFHKPYEKHQKSYIEEFETYIKSSNLKAKQ